MINVSSLRILKFSQLQASAFSDLRHSCITSNVVAVVSSHCSQLQVVVYYELGSTSPAFQSWTAAPAVHFLQRHSVAATTHISVSKIDCARRSSHPRGEVTTKVVIILILNLLSTDVKITIDVRSTRDVRFTIDVTLSAIPTPTRSPMSSWSRGLGQSADQRLPDGGGMRNGLSRITTESHCWRPLGSGEEKG